MNLGVAACIALALSVTTASAQTDVQLTFGGTISFAMASAADYITGSVESTSALPFQVQTASEPTGALTTTVSIRSNLSTLGGAKPVGDLQWRRGDESKWQSLTTVDAIVERRVVQGTPQGHTWDNTLFFRVKLKWTNDPPATYVTGVVITVSTTRS